MGQRRRLTLETTVPILDWVQSNSAMVFIFLPMRSRANQSVCQRWWVAQATLKHCLRLGKDNKNMKIINTIIKSIGLLALASTLLCSSAQAAPLGQLAPDFELSGNGATTVKLSALRGKVVYLDFWASWCGPCRQSFPWMNDLQAKYGSRGLQIVGVNLDAKDSDARKFLAENNARFLLAFDNKGATPKLYGVKGMPTSYLIDRDGRIVSEHTGFNFSKTAGLEKEIEKLLENK